MLLPSFFFFFNDTATTEIYTLSLHDALPISPAGPIRPGMSSVSRTRPQRPSSRPELPLHARDRKSTRLNSSHGYISYAVFCLKKKYALLIATYTAGADAGSYLTASMS